VSGIFFALSQQIIKYPLSYFGLCIDNLVKGVGENFEYWMLPYFFSSVLVKPIFEELFFRKFLFKTLGKEVNLVTYVLVSSLLFSLAHLPNCSQAYVAFFGGAISSVVFFKWRSVLACIVFHASWNISAHLINLLL
jgi:hypothetical protein